jgi:hypothetical protein
MNLFNLPKEQFEDYLKKTIDNADGEELLNKLIKNGLDIDMSTPRADNIFKRIGYRRVKTQNNWQIKYYKDDDNVINFDVEDKTVRKDGEYCETCYGITMDELKAIGIFARESGWL